MAYMEIKEELGLVARAQSGEREAFTLLWDNITPKLFGYLVNVLREKNLAEDILQETWLKAISSLSRFRARGVRFSAWLFAIAKNECRQHWRNGVKEVPTDDIDSLQKNVHESDSGNNLMIETAFAGLSEDEREILRLRFLCELSFKEIASVIGVSIIAARVRVHRALSHARAILRK